MPKTTISRRLTAIIDREGDGYVALCPELDIASQGDTLEGTRVNLIEALTLFFETADPSELFSVRPAGCPADYAFDRRIRNRNK